MAKTDLSKLKGLSEQDRKQIKDAEEMLGPEPETMGFVKNLFWGNFREELVFPFPEIDPAETKRCDEMLAELDDYLRNEHPAIEIDQKQEIPVWAVQRMQKIGVMGMIVPEKYGGGGFGITSYNRILARIGRTCGSSAVMVSAHQSIGCGALMLFGTEEQREKYLYKVGFEYLSAFCLSEPNVGSDAGGQETRCEVSEDGEHYILNGEKKWATSAALSGLFTVLCKQAITSKKTGKTKDKVTALICTPDMEGIDLYSRNRSKCGIRGTWQGRITFKDVKVPKENLLHKEGGGLRVALTCLDYGRCTLAAGMVGAGYQALEQAGKWARYRYQFDRPIEEFEQTQQKLADMAAWCHAMDAMLYMTTGQLDRDDDDIMLETAICKVFCSEYGFNTVDHAMQIMGGESYMTENQLERLWRDSRLNRIVEGANEVMHAFIFGYGTKQLLEYLVEVKENPFKHVGTAMKLGSEMFLGIRKKRPAIRKLHPSIAPLREKLETYVQEFAHQVKLTLKKHQESLISKQCIQARLSWGAIWLHAMSCSLSVLDMNIRKGKMGAELEDERKIVTHLVNHATKEMDRNFRELTDNTDDTLHGAYEAIMRHIDKLPNSDYAIPEKTPVEDVRGTGHQADQSAIPQFGSGFVEGYGTAIDVDGALDDDNED